MALFDLRVVAVLLLVSQPFDLAFAQQAGVCDRQADDILQGLRRDTDARIGAVNGMQLPDDEKQALILLHLRARDRALLSAEQMRQVCTANYMPKQQMANIVVSVYTAGLSEFLPSHLTYVDVSEIMDGRPLGGPNAAIPKARDDTLNTLGIGGDAKKIIQDPKKVLPWNW